MKELNIDGVIYTPKTEKVEGMEFVICRTYSAGVFAGYLKKREGQEVTLLQARRLWSWVGAASLSQLAMEGVKKPNDCKFAMEVDSVLLLQAIEILPCTGEAIKNIQGVPVWKQK
jgi:hypothetical protein